MSDKSGIEWTEATWNFLIGCLKKSKGCMNCYAILVAWRMIHNPNAKIAKKFAGTVAKDNAGNLNWTGRINFDEDTLALPLKWEEPRNIFVNSLSDLFHPNVKDEWIDAAFAVMAFCYWHTFQILTKHPERAVEYFANMESRMNAIGDQAFERFGWTFSGDATSDDFVQFNLPLANVQILASVEDQPTADERIPQLLRILAAVRGISAEPLIGPIVLKPEWTEIEFPRLDWVIVGGESGSKARPMHPDWVRSLRDQCVAADVPFFFKQWGKYLPLGTVIDGDEVIDRTAVFDQDGHRLLPDCCGNDYDVEPNQIAVRFGPVGKKAAGRMLDGREWSEYPEAP